MDILINHEGRLYALELKSYKDQSALNQAIGQAAEYGAGLNLETVYLIVFVEYMPEEYREKYEVDSIDEETGVTVSPVFVATGN